MNDIDEDPVAAQDFKQAETGQDLHGGHCSTPNKSQTSCLDKSNTMTSKEETKEKIKLQKINSWTFLLH